MATTDLNLEDCGTLSKPGPYGRISRLILGALCLYYVQDLWSIRNVLLDDSQSLNSMLLSGIVFGLFLISYVINIGYSLAWKKWPALISAGVFSLIAGLGYMMTGNAETVILARTIHVWDLYIFTHLGLSFVIAAAVGAPGCEMRAFHYFYTLITGKPTKEHLCPIGPVPKIDKWEAARKDK